MHIIKNISKYKSKSSILFIIIYMRNIYRKKRTYQETVILPASPYVEIKERKSITIFDQKDYDESSQKKKKEVFNEETLKLISALKKKNEHILNSSSSKLINPFLNSNASKTKELNAPTNFGSVTNCLNNPFITKAWNFNFNFNFVNNTNSAFEKDTNENEESNDEEESKENFNPEEEREIFSFEKLNDDVPIVKIENHSVKYANSKLEILHLYDFSVKKYICKGKGKISLELFKGDNNSKGIVVFRAGEGTSVLFQGNIIPDMTSFEESKKDIFVLVLNKVFTQKEEKLENNALKMKYSSIKDKEVFIKGFNHMIEDIKANSITKERSGEVNQEQNPIEVKAELIKEEKAQSKKGSQVKTNQFLLNEDKKLLNDKASAQSVVINNPFLDFISNNKNNPVKVLAPLYPINITEPNYNKNNNDHQENNVQSKDIHISKFVFGSRK